MSTRSLASTGTVLLLSLAVFASADLASAAEPKPSKTRRPTEQEIKASQALDRALADVTQAFELTQQCYETEASLRADYEKKKTQLEAEHRGAVPVAFTDLLWAKTQRIRRHHQSCFDGYQNLGKAFDGVQLLFRTQEPPSPNFKQQRARFDALKARYLRMVPTDVKTPAKKK